VSAWLVIGDTDLRALLLTIAEEVGLSLDALDPREADRRLAAGEVPPALLVAPDSTSGMLPADRLRRVRRLALASTDGSSAGLDGVVPGMQLRLPASLDDVENVLRWLVWDGAQVARSSSEDSSSRLA
jgi:hypothetical protein